MTDLTEQWKKGELLEGFYYVKCDWSDEVEIRYVHNGVDDWKEIIAEVPSYEKFLALQSDSIAKNEGVEINAELENRMNLERELYKKVLEENTHIKYLLHKVKGIIASYHLTGHQNIYSDNDMEGCVAQIEQVLGEDK